MHLGIILSCTFLASILMLSNILPSYAGDPVPGIDVSLEQIPGGIRTDDGRPSFGVNDLGKVTISSPTDNISDTVQDTIKAYVFSSSDPKGLPVTLMETTPNSGLFVGEFSIGSNPADGKSRTAITASPVSTVFVEYNGVRTNGFVGGDPAYAKNYNSSRSNVSKRDNNSGDTPNPDPQYAKSASRGIVVGQGGDARVLSTDETTRIDSIIMKLQTMLSQSNNPDALKLLSELGSIWNKPSSISIKEEGVNKASNPEIGDEVIVAKEKDVNKAAKEVKPVAPSKEVKPVAPSKEVKPVAPSKEVKKGLNTIDVKAAIGDLKIKIKDNAKALKLLQGLETKISEAAKVSADNAVDPAIITQEIEKLRKELTKSDPTTLKSFKTLEDALAQYSKFAIANKAGGKGMG